MTVTVQPPSPPSSPPVDPQSDGGGDQRVLLEGVSWTAYERLLKELNDRPIHLTYDDGTLEIFTPGDEHERVKKIVARLIEAYSDETGIDAEGLGSWTLKRKKSKKALEPDECYYVANLKRVVGLKRKLDLKKDPPPDVAIEVDITSGSVPRQPIYAALGVPELWRYDGERFAPLLRQPDGTYAPAAASVAFPAFAMEQLNRCLAIGLAETQSAAVRALREWMRTSRDAGSLPPV